ncbi:MAG: hypothetical protein F2600_01895 [Actinobacteria bacterium]|uniref:Unannotated protein n=1 Tax=freshwater metagenome TaxID=449393 RepID=A0A6J6I5M0_9ZZZZ|nr:hypothetical protein [Actinomycetota bacterium]
MRPESNRSLSFRLLILIFGLFVYGLGVAMTVHASLGIAPWDVFAQGISIQTGLSFGVSTVVVSALVLLAWIPLKVKPGIGTIANAVLIGLFADFWLLILPDTSIYWQRLLIFLAGVVIVAIATGLYISSALGSGPRDGLMQGTANALDKPFWMIRTGYEGTVLTLGALMGGQVREGTLIFALSIGYLVQLSMKFFKIPKG